MGRLEQYSCKQLNMHEVGNRRQDKMGGNSQWVICLMIAVGQGKQCILLIRPTVKTKRSVSEDESGTEQLYFVLIIFCV